MFRTPTQQAGDKLQGIFVSPNNRPLNFNEMLIIKHRMEDIWVLAHEIGHYIGWKEGREIHSKDPTNLMSWYKGTPKPDCQWCEKIMRVAQ